MSIKANTLKVKKLLKAVRRRNEKVKRHNFVHKTVRTKLEKLTGGLIK